MDNYTENLPKLGMIFISRQLAATEKMQGNEKQWLYMECFNHTWLKI